MKKGYLICTLGVVVLLAAWLLRPATPASGPATASAAIATLPTPASTPAAQTIVAPPKLALAPQVVAPKIAPAPVVKPATQVIIDAQKDLSTAIPDLVKLVESGDLVTAWQTYAQPDHFAEIPLERRAQVDDRLRALSTNPQGQMRVQVLTQALGALSTQTPTLNDAGDVATYQLSGPAASVGAKAIHFKNVDGRWYIANDDLDNIGRLLGL